MQILGVHVDKLQVFSPDAVSCWPQHRLLLTLCHGAAGALKKLTLHGNQLREVSPALGQLQQLQELMLQGNQLRSIPPELFQLKVSWNIVHAYVWMQAAQLQCAWAVLQQRLAGSGSACCVHLWPGMGTSARSQQLLGTRTHPLQGIKWAVLRSWCVPASPCQKDFSISQQV